MRTSTSATEHHPSCIDMSTKDKNMPFGTVKFFNEAKGFGFITPDDGGDDLFIHISNVNPSEGILSEGQKVSFEIGQGRKGPEANEVRSA